MNTVWAVQDEIPVALQIVPLDVKIFSTEEKARAYFIRELDSLKNYYDGPEADFVMPPDIAERSEEELVEQMYYEAKDGSSWLIVEPVEVDDDGLRLPSADEEEKI